MNVSVNIVLEIVKKCFPHLLASPEGQARMREMIPNYDTDIKLPENARFYREISRRADDLLQLSSPQP